MNERGLEARLYTHSVALSLSLIACVGAAIGTIVCILCMCMCVECLLWSIFDTTLPCMGRAWVYVCASHCADSGAARRVGPCLPVDHSAEALLRNLVCSEGAGMFSCQIEVYLWKLASGVVCV